MKFGRGLLALLLALALILALAQPALAGLRVVGAKVEAEVSPGSETSYNIKVVDNSDAPMDIAIEVKGYGTSAEGTLQVLEPEEDTSPYSAREFLAVSPDSFHLEPGESQDVTATAKIPAEVGNGGRYAVVFIHTVPGEGSFAVVTAVAVPVILTISGSKMTKESEVSEVSLGEIASEEPLEATVTVTNKGNYHYKPQVEAKIMTQGKIVATCASVTSSYNLIPDNSQQLKLGLVADEPLPAGSYEVEIEVKDEAGDLVASHSYSLDLGEVWQPPPEPTPEPTPEATPEATPEPMSWQLIGVIVGGAAVVGLLTYFYFPLFRRRQRARRK